MRNHCLIQKKIENWCADFKAKECVKKPVLGTGALCAQCSECTLQRLWMRPTKILETSEMMISWINDQRMIIIVIRLLFIISMIMKYHENEKFLLLLWWLWLDDQQDFPIVRQSSSCRRPTRHATLLAKIYSIDQLSSTSAKNQQVWSLPTDSIWGGEPKPAGRSAAALSICPMCYCAIVLYLCLQSEGHPLLVVWRWDVLTQLVLILAVLSMTKISKTEVAQNESYLTCLYLGCSSMCLLYQFLRAQAFPSLLPRCLRLCLV